MSMHVPIKHGIKDETGLVIIIRVREQCEAVSWSRDVRIGLPRVQWQCLVVIISHIQRIDCQTEKTTQHGGPSRLWSAEEGKENTIKKASSASLTPTPTLLVRRSNRKENRITHNARTTKRTQRTDDQKAQGYHETHPRA